MSTVAELIAQNREKGQEVRDAHLTHTIRLVRVLDDIVKRNGAMLDAMREFSQAPSHARWLAITQAENDLSITVDELLEATHAHFDDTQAIFGLVIDAWQVVKVAVNE